jgi:hypothetical protein
MSKLKVLKHYGALKTIDALVRMFSKEKKGDSNCTQSTAKTVRVCICSACFQVEYVFEFQR